MRLTEARTVGAAAALALLAALAAPALASAPAALRIDYYGDSTIWGYDPAGGGRVATPAPAAFARILGPHYVVRNEGVNGTTACQLLEGEDGRHPAWAQQMAKSDADFVIIDFGINDEWKYGVRRYAQCLHELARGARQHGKRVIFETPNPTRDSGPEGLDVYVDAMRSVAATEAAPVIDQYRALKDYLAGANPATICPDGLHPTQAVYLMKGRFAAAEFLRLYGGPR